MGGYAEVVGTGTGLATGVRWPERKAGKTLAAHKHLAPLPLPVPLRECELFRSLDGLGSNGEPLLAWNTTGIYNGQ